MRRYLLSVLLSIVALGMAQAKDITVTIHTDAPGVAKYAVNGVNEKVIDGTEVTFTTDNMASWGGIGSLLVAATTDYVLNTCTYSVAGGEQQTAEINSWADGYYIDMEDNLDITVTSSSLEATRTNAITVIVDDPSKVTFCRDYEPIELVAGENTVKYSDAEYEDGGFSIEGKDGASLYEVKQNGNILEDNYGYRFGGYYPNVMTSGDVIEITAAFPEGNGTIRVTCTDPAIDVNKFVTKMQFNYDEQDLTQYDFAAGAVIPIGTPVNLQFDNETFAVNAFTENGVEKEFYGYWDTSALRGDYVLNFDLTEKQTETCTIHVDDPAFVNVHSGAWASDYNKLTLDENGNATLTWLTGESNAFTLTTNGKGTITSVTIDGEAVERQSEYSQTYGAVSGATIEVTSEQMQPTGHVAVVCHNGVGQISFSVAANSGSTYYDINNMDGAVTIVPLYEGDDNFFDIYAYKQNYDCVEALYINQTLATSDWGEYNLSIAADRDYNKVKDGDIIRIYGTAEGVAVDTASLTIAEGLPEGFTAKLEGFKDVETAEDGTFETMTGAMVYVYVPEEANVADFGVTADGVQVSYDAQAKAFICPAGAIVVDYNIYFKLQQLLDQTLAIDFDGIEETAATALNEAQSAAEDILTAPADYTDAEAQAAYDNLAAAFQAASEAAGILATGIEKVESTTGRIAVYNLQGQRVSAATKGVYIVGGKKVVLK